MSRSRPEPRVTVSALRWRKDAPITRLAAGRLDRVNVWDDGALGLLFMKRARRGAKSVVVVHLNPAAARQVTEKLGRFPA